MAQTDFNRDLNVLTEGQLVSDRLNSKVISRELSDNSASFGRFLGAANAEETLIQNLYSDQATAALDADFVASNVLAGNIFVNGTATPLSISWASNHAGTMAAFEAAVEAIEGIASATVGGANNRTLTVAADPGYDIYFGPLTITGGSSQAGVTVANTCTAIILGPSVQEELAPNSDGTVAFENKDTIGVLRQGNIAVQADGTINPSGTVYIRFFEESASNKKRGMLSTSAGSSPTKAIAYTGAYKVEQAMSAEALGVLALNNV